MYIHHLQLINRVDFAIGDIRGIDTIETSTDDLAELISRELWTEWGHPNFVSLVDGDWTDDIINIELEDEDTGKIWEVCVNLHSLDAVIE